MSTMEQVEYMNTCLAELPELELSKIARYPLELTSWVNPSDKVSGEIPAFIPHQVKEGEQAELRQDYVWGPNTHGTGYYHVWTKQAYKILTNRVTRELHSTAKYIRKYTDEEKTRRKNLKVAKDILVLRSEANQGPMEFNPTQLDAQRKPEYVNNGAFTRTALLGAAAGAIPF